MKPLMVNRDCPGRGKKLKNLLKAARYIGYDRVRFKDNTFITCTPTKLRRTRGDKLKRTKYPVRPIVDTLNRTFYAILIIDEDRFLFVDKLRQVSLTPVWRSLSYINSQYNKIAEYYTEKGYEITLINEKHTQLRKIHNE